ncbi:MAG: radical SAM protein [Candidatus Bathyarchaeota archaeon]
MNERGYKIVLTAPATEMSDHYKKIFVGFGACISDPPFPRWFVKLLFYPPVSHHKGRVDYAPYAIRKIEANLLENGFSEDDLIMVHPNHLNKVVGPETKIVGITVMDPLGLGPTSLTFSSFLHGDSATYIEFKNLMKTECFKKYNPKIVVGGMGAWQLYAVKDAQEKYGLSTVVIGEGEKIVPELFEKSVNGEDSPKVIFAEEPVTEQVPVIRNPSVGGLVEISRGCGRNCQFCVPTLRRKWDSPIEKIVKEIKVNLEGKCPSICLHAEDALIYGSGPSDRFRPNRDKVVELFTKVTQATNGLPIAIGVSHVSPAPIAADPTLVSSISEILQIGKVDHARLFGYQIGIETGSVRLIKKFMAGKPLPYKPEEWPDVVELAFGISKDFKWVPAATLIMGLPGETVDDVNASLELMDRLKDCPSFIVPQFFMPITDTIMENQKTFDTKNMFPEHWQLLNKCTDHSVRWADHLRTLYFAPESPFLRFGFWLGYRLLYMFAFFGGRKASKKYGYKKILDSLPKTSKPKSD